jgi:hypothetical protein
LPYTKFRSFEDLPVLDKNDAKTLFMVLGTTFGLLGAGVAFSLFMTGTVSHVDPMLSESVPVDFVFWLVLIAISGLIASKQWHYYYGNGSPKDGIFVEKLKQTSVLEQYADVALSFAGGLLGGLVALPSFWFLGFASYCVLVTVRCYITLMRPRYAAKARKKGEDIPEFIVTSIDALHNGLLVKGVLAGWILSDVLYVIYSLASFVVCFCVLGKLWVLWRIIAFLAITGVLAVLFLHVVRRHSYNWGLWLLRRVGMLSPNGENESLK